MASHEGKRSKGGLKKGLHYRSDYAIGFGRPPREHQFKKGKSGNPKGRPNGPMNFKAMLVKFLNTKIDIVDNGRNRTVTRGEALILATIARAAKDPRLALFMLDQASFWEEREKESGDLKITEGMSDEEAAELYAKTLRQGSDN